MSDIGIKLAQLGYNVKVADDKNLVFSSAWKLLKIRKTGVVVPNSFSYTVYTHNLGYVPMVLTFYERQIDNTFTVGTSRLIASTMDDSNIEFNSGATGSNTARLRYFMFDLDIEEAYDAPSIVLTPASKESELVDKDFGIKLTLPGYDVTTEADFRNYVLHSRTRSPMIHRVVPGSKALGGSAFAVSHDLGYPPMFFVFAKLAGNTHYQLLQTASDTFSSADGDNVNVFIPYECDYSIIILKDPLLLSS